MIHKIIKGRGFGGCLRYILNKRGASLIGGSYERDASASRIAVDMRRVASASDRVEKPVFHSVLSLAPGEILTNAQWEQAARTYLEELGFADCPFVVVRHTDRDHDHVHLVASRVTYQGKVVSAYNDHERGQTPLRAIESRFGLSSPPKNSPHRAPRQGEYRAAKQGAGPHVRAFLQKEIRRAADGKPDLDQFLLRLKGQGIATRFNVTGGVVRGISFEYQGIAHSGSSLGRPFSWSGLRNTLGVSFDPSLHGHLIQGAQLGRSAPATSWSRESLESLATALRRLGAPPRGASLARAAVALRNQGADALRASARALHLVNELSTPMASARRRLVKNLPGGELLSLGMSFFGAFSSPKAAFAFALHLATRSLSAIERASQASRGQSEARGALVQYARAAASDAPDAKIFFARLAESGIEVDFPPQKPAMLRAGDISISISNLDRSTQGLFKRHEELERQPDGGDRASGERSHRAPEPRSANAAPRFGDSRATHSVGRDADFHGNHLVEPEQPDFGRYVYPSPHQPNPGGGLGIANQRHATTGSGFGTPRLSPHPGGRVDDGPADRSLPTNLDARSRGGAPPGAREAGSEWLFRAPGAGAATAPRPPAEANLGESLKRQIATLGGEEFDIRIGPAQRPLAFERLTPANLDALLPRLVEADRQGLELAIRSRTTEFQFVGWALPSSVHSAAEAGFEPALALRLGDRVAVWVRHAPAPHAVQPFLQRAVRLAYGMEPLGRQVFGPIAGRSAEILSSNGDPYRRATELATALTESRAERLVDLGHRLRAVGVPSLELFRRSAPDPGKADLDWTRLALSRGIASTDALGVLASQGSRRNASPRTQIAYAARCLAAARGERALSAPSIVQTVANALGVSIRIVGAAVKALRVVERLAR